MARTKNSPPLTARQRAFNRALHRGLLWKSARKHVKYGTMYRIPDDRLIIVLYAKNAFDYGRNMIRIPRKQSEHGMVYLKRVLETDSDIQFKHRAELRPETCARILQTKKSAVKLLFYAFRDDLRILTPRQE